MLEIADAIVKEGKAAAAARGESPLATASAQAEAAAAAVELGPAGVDLSPFVLCELTLPTLRAPPSAAAVKAAEAAGGATGAAHEGSRAGCGRRGRPWPALVEAYFENYRRANE